MNVNKVMSSISIRGLELPNRVAVSPMCTFMGVPGNNELTDSHFVHYASFAQAGYGLVMQEATNVSPHGFLSIRDLSLHTDAQIPSMKKLNDFVHAHAPAKTCIQLCHAGRKGPWSGDKKFFAKQLGPEDEFGFQCEAPSAIAWDNTYHAPKELSEDDIDQIVEDFVSATKRAVAAGYDCVEMHAAHGYLIHQFFSPISNKRTDSYGGDRHNRARFAVRVARAMRKVMPDDMPLLARISAVDWIEGGVTIEDSIYLSQKLKEVGVDAIDVSTGGIDPAQKIEIGHHFQIGFCEKIREATGMVAMCVGGIAELDDANGILEKGEADIVCVGRAAMNNPYWLRTELYRLDAIDKAFYPDQQQRGRLWAAKKKAEDEPTAKPRELETKEGAETAEANSPEDKQTDNETASVKN